MTQSAAKDSRPAEPARPARPAADPLAPFERMREEFMQMAENFWRGAPPAAFSMPGAAALRWAEPAIDLSETDEAYILTAEAPGVAKDDLEVTIENGLVTITGEKHDAHKAHRRHHQYAERRYGAFTRSLMLPRDADADGAQADFADGLLTLTVPKTNGGRKHKRVAIR